MDRKSYWDQNYLQYWKAKVDEANCSKELIINKNDIKTITDDLIFEYCDLVNMKQEERVLDFGCGFCRSYPYFADKKLEYWGIDISAAMIEESKKMYSELSDYLLVTEGEKTLFESNYFDYLLCFGVFDACYQEAALEEMLRVLKVNGYIILTGKNFSYFNDDTKAVVAEENARLKGHPNYFTNVSKMLEQIKEQGHEIEKSFYFPRRGDFQERIYYCDIQENFYEYLLIIKKKNNITKNFERFSDSYSDTYKRIKK